jgi:Diguanylate cyclase, GGDEF domain
LIEGLSHCLIDEKTLSQFEQGGLYYKQAATLGRLQRDGADAIVSLADSLSALEDAIWDTLADGLRREDKSLIDLVRVLRAGLHRIMTAATEAYHVQSSAELDRLAHTDSLTGLYNRRYWEPELARYVELYKRYRHPFAILMLDFDNLKWVNDTFGHQAGDRAHAPRHGHAHEHPGRGHPLPVWGRRVPHPHARGRQERHPDGGPQDIGVHQQDQIQAGPLFRQPAGEFRRCGLP